MSMFASIVRFALLAVSVVVVALCVGRSELIPFAAFDLILPFAMMVMVSTVSYRPVR
jgi:hypothetical protein